MSRGARGRHGDCRTGAAGEGLAAAALEGALPQSVRPHHGHELDVHAVRKRRMLLQRLADALHVGSVDVGDEADRMWIAGVPHREFELPRPDRQPARRLHHDLAHADPDLAVAEQFDRTHPGVGVDAETPFPQVAGVVREPG
jgi:hypothetical protein